MQASVSSPVVTDASRPGARTRLFLASFLMLFVELALIRWSAANVVYLAYFTNFVLLASFLGIGVGFLRAKAARDLFAWVPVGLAALAGFLLLFPVQVARTAEGRMFEGLFGMFALPAWITLPIVFLGVAAVLAFIAQGVARLFAVFEPLEAYRLDILGSMAGIAAFSILSFLGARPVTWGVVAAVVLVALLGPRMTTGQKAGLALLVAFLGAGSLSPLDRWSPYYRVTVGETTAEGGVPVKVNGIPHQGVLPVQRLEQAQPFYLHAYGHLAGNPLDDVLIIGAGTGNDVAVALRQGAAHIDAVEIDPVLLETGRERHPDRPYQDSRVTSIVNDGRAYLERTEQRYDLIVLALPDSLTLVTGQSSLRLESYLFTREALTTAKEHLKPGGALTMYNYYRPFVFDRFAGTLATVFEHRPCFDSGEAGRGVRRQAVLTVGRQAGDVDCSILWAPLTSDVPDPATDDHPFPYLPEPSIPQFYLVALALIVAASLVIVRFAAGGSLAPMRGYLDLFFMGAAFLLLETKSVVQFALLFGTTWFVNSLVFGGILLAVYAAVEVARRVRLPPAAVLYAGLFASVALAWVVRPDILLAFSPVPRFFLATAIAFAPVFLANLVFAQRFRDVGSSTTAFGANLLGAMIGGVLEYGALVVGYRNLLVLVGVLYGLAFVAGRRLVAGRPAPAPVEHVGALAGGSDSAP